MVNKTQNTELVSSVISGIIANQSTYQRYSNTINSVLAAIVGSLIALGALWTSTGEFPGVTAVVLAITPVLTGVVTRLTKNGVTPSVEKTVVDKIHEVETEPVFDPQALPVYDFSATEDK